MQEPKNISVSRIYVKTTATKISTEREEKEQLEKFVYGNEKILNELGKNKLKLLFL